MQAMSDELWTVNFGRLEYRAATDLQERVRVARQQELVPDVLLLLEHDPVYTRTRRTGPQDLAMGEAWYRARGIDVVDVNRGGRVTYHGPGQLTGYAIMRTDSALRFVRTMERGLVAALADEGIDARARPEDGTDFTGVWIGERKIASVGVHVQKGVTMHGFAVNVQNDLQPFNWVVACGLPDVQMTSLLKESGRTGELLACHRKRVAHRFAEAFGLRQRIVTPARLEKALAAVPAAA